MIQLSLFELMRTSGELNVYTGVCKYQLMKRC